MTSIQQRDALRRQIWQIANDVRGWVDGWDFKQYVLGTLFYRFISENFAAYIEAGDPDIHDAELADSVITPEIKDDAIKTKGYFIYPSQLFAKVLATANTNESLNTDLAANFSAIESSVNGYPSEKDIKGLFADFDTTSSRLGNTLTDDHVGRIMEVFDTKENVPHFAASADHATVAEKDYKLSVSTYVEAKDTREVVDIGQLNAELETTVAKINRLRADIDAIVAEIEGEEVAA
jgi:type I restriction enzyme M protein